VALGSTDQFAARATGLASSPYSRAHPGSSIFEGGYLFERVSHEDGLQSIQRSWETHSGG
jgi:hypothetical protein